MVGRTLWPATAGVKPPPGRSLALPANCEATIDREIERLLAQESGWLIFNTHGSDDEGWGPIRATYLDQLIERVLARETVEALPAGRALARYAP